jgi:hypothetical protein
MTDFTGGALIGSLPLAMENGQIVQVQFRESPWGDTRSIVLVLPPECEGAVTLPRALLHLIADRKAVPCP